MKQYNKPLFVAEAGIADEKDFYREDYIRDMLYWMHVAIERGAVVRGFLYWSLLDNYEWAHGFGKRFGLIEIDYENQKRTIRKSALAYRDICKSNSLHT